MGRTTPSRIFRVPDGCFPDVVDVPVPILHMIGHAFRARLEVTAFLKVILKGFGVLTNDFPAPGVLERLPPSSDCVVPDRFAGRSVRVVREGVDRMRIPVIRGCMGTQTVGCPAARGPLAVRRPGFPGHVTPAWVLRVPYVFPDRAWRPSASAVILIVILIGIGSAPVRAL